MCVHLCGSQRSMSSVFLSLFNFCDRVFYWRWNRLILRTNKPQGPSCVFLPSTGLTGACQHTFSLQCSLWGSELRLQACIAGTLLTRLSHHPLRSLSVGRGCWPILEVAPTADGDVGSVLIFSLLVGALLKHIYKNNQHYPTRLSPRGPQRSGSEPNPVSGFCSSMTQLPHHLYCVSWYALELRGTHTLCKLED